MLPRHASWHVQYQDGTDDWQYNAASPAFDALGGEVPFRGIRWHDVTQLTLSSELAECTFQVTPPPEGYQLSLRSRVFVRVDGIEVRCFMIILSRSDAPSVQDGTEHVWYWFPDDTLHECALFDCPEIARYGCHAVHGRDLELVPRHGHIILFADSVLAA